MDSDLPLVSVLFVTYKRFELLRTTVEAFRAHTSYPNLQLVVTDDGSPAEVQAAIRTLPVDAFSLPAKNRGLGANTNAGIRLCTGKYILFLQDDWVCAGPPDYLLNSVRMMEQNPQVGLINYAGGPNLPDKTQPLGGSPEPCYVVWQVHEDDPAGSYLYSDQPHLQSRAALEHVGLYKEARKMEECERDYEIRWAAQTQFKTAIFPAYFMRVFSNEGVPLSHRTNSMRNRVDAALLPMGNVLKKYCRPAFTLGKFTLRTAQNLLERIGLMK